MHKRNTSLLVSSTFCVAVNLWNPAQAAAAVSCESLRTLSLPHTTITLAEAVTGGTFLPPGAKPDATLTNLPSFCRVAASLTPSSDSDIKIEVWLPTTDWNAKFQAVGNGGWAGSISYAAMQRALQEGYATASTDTGHIGANTQFAFGHPEKMVDFAYRAVHEMTIASKAIIAAFYGQTARLSYWNGCSTGGRQGLMEAQRYPEDFDGIIAGAPANYMTHLGASHIATGAAVLKDPASQLTPKTYELLNKAVVAACDAHDGVKDGLLADPRACRFDPAALLCRAGASEDCLTAPQVEAVKKVYAPTRTSTGELIYPALQPGSELAWGPVTGGPAPFTISMWMFRYLYNDVNWDWRTFDVDRDTALAIDKVGFTNAIQTDLSAFKKRGGKLLLYHGWNDHLIAPENTVNYYSGVLSIMGGDQADWIRLFMAPGMQHCSGGPGPNQINWVAALERWRETGDAPDQIPAYRVNNNRVDMTRPLCPYPQLAVYKGVGSANDAANFVCRRP